MNFTRDFREGKDVKGYDIQSEEAQMRRSNEKYYDKMTKSSLAEKSPKRDQKSNLNKSEMKSEDKTTEHK